MLEKHTDGNSGARLLEKHTDRNPRDIRRQSSVLKARGELHMVSTIFGEQRTLFFCCCNFFVCKNMKRLTKQVENLRKPVKTVRIDKGRVRESKKPTTD